MTIKSSQDMRVQLDQIADGIEERLCRFYLPELVDPGQVEWVEIGGIRIDRDETGKTGWKLSPYGAAILLSAEECRKTAKIATPDVVAIACSSSYGQGHYGN